MKKRDDWQLLIQRHLDGLTTAKEADELSTAIIEDDEVRADYLKAAKVHAELTDDGECAVYFDTPGTIS